MSSAAITHSQVHTKACVEVLHLQLDLVQDTHVCAHDRLGF